MGNSSSITTTFTTILAAAASCAMLATFTTVPAQAASCTLGASTVAQCFPDQALAKSVADAARIRPDDVLTEATAASVRTVIPDSLVAKDIRSLDGLSVLPNLDTFASQGMESLTSLNGLRGSKSLKDFRISHAYHLTDVDAVRDVPTLEHLAIEQAPLTSASAFHDMPNLKTLDINKSNIADVDGLRGLPSLYQWHIGVQDISKTVTVAKGSRFSIAVPTLFGMKPDTVDAIWNGGTYDSSTGMVTWTEGAGRDGVYRFDFAARQASPAGSFNGTVTVTVNTENRGGFSDVSSATPHYEDIQWLSSSGITTGYSDGTFKPAVAVNRQDMAAFLYRLAGSPNYTPDWSNNPFSDVTPFSSHAKEIMWLNEAGITKGYPDGTFGGTRPVVRQDMAAFLHRLADYLHASAPSGQAKSFSDVSSGTPHAEDIAWLSKTGVTSGYPDGTFGGTRPVIRQDMAAFLHRMSLNVLK